MPYKRASRPLKAYIAALCCFPRRPESSQHVEMGAPICKMGLGLDQLPTEILILICSHLCEHCCGIPMRRDAPIEWTEASCALANLSSTSRTLNRIAQPLLYHRIYKVASVNCFIRTLVQRPDLAASVVQLNAKYLMTPFVRYHNADIGYLEEVGQKLHQYDPLELQRQGLTFGQWYMGVYQFLDLAIALLPNLDSLCFMIVGNSSPSTYKSLMSSRLGKPYLQHLSKLWLSTDYNVYRGFWLSDADIGLMRCAAANLRHLVLDGAKDFGAGVSSEAFLDAEFPPFTQLHTLELRRSFNAEDQSSHRFLERMASLSPNLVRLRYAGQNVHRATQLLRSRKEDPAWRERPMLVTKILQAIQPWSKVLKVLEIDFLGDNDDSVWEGNWHYAVGELLAPFNALHTLKLDESCIPFPALFETPSPHRESDSACLINIIPQTLTEFHLVTGANKLLWESLRRLGKGLGATKFTSLERIVVVVDDDQGTDLDEHVDTIRPYFEEARVNIEISAHDDIWDRVSEEADCLQ